MNKMLLLLILLAVLSRPSFALTELKCAYQDSDNFPYQLGDSTKINRQYPGIAVEMVLLLEQKLPVKVSLLRLPWRRAEKRLKKGLIDCLFNASYKTVRLLNGAYPMLDGEVDVSKRSYYNAYSLFSQKNSQLQWDGNELINNSRKPIGVQGGFSIRADLVKQRVNVYEAATVKQLMQLLQKNRLSGVATFEVVGDAFLRKFADQYPNIVKLQPAFKSKAYFLMLSHQFVRANPELAKDIWRSIGEIRESDEFREILDKYVGE